VPSCFRCINLALFSKQKWNQRPYVWRQLVFPISDNHNSR
jgi:hypothetical protein